MQAAGDASALDPRDPRPETAQALRAWLAFQSVFAWRPAEAAGLLWRVPEPMAAARTVAAPVPDPDALQITAWLEALRRAVAVAVPLTSQAYPERLRRLPDPPPLLLVQGAPDALRERAVAVVGARASTAYGVAAARELAEGLAGEGLVVVSGLARGIDAAAHRAVLEAGGRTVAVQACGPDRVYPPSHRRLAAEIAQQGAVVSELPPGTPPLPHHFPFRNRVISGLVEAVVVVEARERSGSLVTARHALDQGREVLAVPGPIYAPASRGTNRLLRDGAAPALEVDDVLRALGLPPAKRGRRPGRRPRDTEQTRRIAAALARAPATRDELQRRLKLDAGALALAILELELEGRVAEDRDGRLRVVSRDISPEL